MSDAYMLGGELREFLNGLLGGSARSAANPNPSPWGPKIDINGLPDLYAPQERIREFSPTPGGIDNLSLTSTDVFNIPGRGEFEVQFSGYFRVARQNPTRDDWATSEVFVNMLDIRLKGHADGIGGVSVSINPEVVSAGQVFANRGGATVAKACRIAAAVRFEMEDVGVTAFNKEPILLMNEGITSIPPVEDPRGEAHIFLLPLYDVRNPDGRPIAHLSRLRYTVGNYISRDEAERLRRS